MKLKKKKSKEFLSTAELLARLKVKAYILKYWEKKIPELRPIKIANRKYYRKEQLEIFLQIKKLLEQGFTLKMIKENLIPFKDSQNYHSMPLPSTQKKEIFFPLFPDLLPPPSSINSAKTEPQISSWQSVRNIITEVLRELKELYSQL